MLIRKAPPLNSSGTYVTSKRASLCMSALARVGRGSGESRTFPQRRKALTRDVVRNAFGVNPAAAKLAWAQMFTAA